MSLQSSSWMMRSGRWAGLTRVSWAALVALGCVVGCDSAPQESGSVTTPLGQMLHRADGPTAVAQWEEESHSVESVRTAAPVVQAAATEEQATGGVQLVTFAAESKARAEETFEKEGITLKIADWKAIEALVAAQKGKIVVVDLWSSWCLPCVREYPHLVELQKKYPEQVVCISVNLNYNGSEDSPPHSFVPEVLGFLVKQQSKLINVLSSTPDETIYETIDLASIPVAFVYQADGQLKKRFDNETQAYGDEGFTYKQHIVPLVDELVKQK